VWCETDQETVKGVGRGRSKSLPHQIAVVGDDSSAFQSNQCGSRLPTTRARKDKVSIGGVETKNNLKRITKKKK
jgi:hypothetical protein